MSNRKFPVWVIPLLFVGVIICTLLSGIFLIPAIALFSVMCIIFPSPFLAIVPLSCLLLNFFITSFGADSKSAIYFAADSLTFLLPSVLIAISYFKKYTKSLVVFNGTFGLFIYRVFTTVLNFILSYGSFSKELLNNSIDAQINEIVKLATASPFETQPAALGIIDPKVFEQTLYLMKPLLPAVIISYMFTTAYVTVCIVNFILKLMNIIEKKSYRMSSPMVLAAFFLAALIGNTFITGYSFISVICSSVTTILLPLFLIIGVSVIFDAMSKPMNNKVFPCVLIVLGALLFPINIIIYNLFYLIGCSYSIITGIKSLPGNTKGGNQ